MRLLARGGLISKQMCGYKYRALIGHSDYGWVGATHIILYASFDMNFCLMAVRYHGNAWFLSFWREPQHHKGKIQNVDSPGYLPDSP